jgi:5'-phosphate synthase pdxT subunit
LNVGILAIQGDYAAHAKMLERLGVHPSFIRTSADLDGLDGIILPGGESTTHLKFLEGEGLDASLRKAAARGVAIFGTCAGAILLAREVRNPPQASLGLLDAAVSRNGYGRQVDSDVRFGESKLTKQPLEMVFIRAPIFDELGPRVEVLATSKGRPVMVRQDRVLAATFHPELTEDCTIHKYFLNLVASRSSS